jgi:hypothetical protein
LKTLLPLLLVTVWCGSALAANKRTYMRGSWEVVNERSDAATTGDKATPPVRYQSQSVGTAAAAFISPGSQIGDTYYDYQHNNSLGRMVDRRNNGKVQASWMYAPGPSPSVRNVSWNTIPIAGSPAAFVLDDSSSITRLPLGAAGAISGFVPEDRPGYTNFRSTPNGRGMLLMHDAPETGGVSFSLGYMDLTQGNGVWPGAASYENPPDPAVTTTEAPIWPKLSVSVCGTDTVWHQVAQPNDAAGITYYNRGVIAPAGTAITWDAAPIEFHSTNNLDYIVEAHGTDVYAVMDSSGVGTNVDIGYYKSTDCGVTWGNFTKITNYAAGDAEGMDSHCAAVIDEDGVLHVTWVTVPANGQTTPVNLYHWSSTTGIRLITSGTWINSCVNGTVPGQTGSNGAGAFQLAITDLALSVKPAGVYSADELIYSVWTQYGPTNNDCATLDAAGTTGGYVNGEIYCSVSSNDGLTWDRPKNLTGTITPDCLPDSCASEAWVTAASRADSGVYIAYVEDTHAGGIVQSEGTWTLSPFKILAAEARTPVLEPVISVSPTNFFELNAKPSGGLSQALLSINSVGNADLTFTVTVQSDNGGASHVSVNGGPTYSSGILAGGAPDIVAIDFDAIGLSDPSEHNWRIEVTSNDPTNDPGQGGNAIDVNLQVFAAEIWFEHVDSTLSTGTHEMLVSNDLEMGDQGANGTGFVNLANEEEYMYTGSPVITYAAGTDTLAFHNAFMNSADRTRVQNQSFRPQSEFLVTRDSTIVIGDSSFVADVAQGLASTTDTTIAIDYEIVFPKAPSLSNGAVYRMRTYSLTGATYNNVSLGGMWDIDMTFPDSTGTNAGENAGRGNVAEGWIGGISGETDTSGAIFTPYTSYMGLFYMPVGDCKKNDAVAAQVINNENYVFGASGYEVDSIYTLFQTFGGLGSWGENTHIDTTVSGANDISLMMVDKYNIDITATDTVEWAYGMAVSYLSEADLETTINAIRANMEPACQVDCIINVSGDVNVSGALTSADIIYLVNFVFKGDAPPLPCAANGDVNCSGAVTSADIIYMVNHVFKGQPPPCDICNDEGAQECIP